MRISTTESNYWDTKFLTALLIMIINNGIASTHNSPAKDVAQKAGATVVARHEAALRHFCGRSNCCDYHQNGIKLSKRIKNWQHLLVLELESVIIKLCNVISKYESKKEELESLYLGVTDCERDKCGNFSHFLPKNKKLEQFKCRKFETPKALKKWTLRLLKFFQKGVGHFEKSFQLLISLEESPEFRRKYQSNRSRLRILKEFRTDLNTLSLEIIEVVNATTRKRLTIKPSTTLLKHAQSQTDIMIHEWLTIQHSREFLDKWEKQIEKAFKCWKKGIWDSLKQKKQKSSRKTVQTPKEDEENFIDEPTDANYINELKTVYNKVYREEMKRREKYLPR